MRVTILCLAVVFVVTAWLIPPSEPTGARGWCCTRHEHVSFAGIAGLSWDQCTQWIRREER